MWEPSTAMWQGTALAGLFFWILSSSYLNVTRKLRSFLQPFVIHHVHSGTPLVLLQIQSYRLRILNVFFSGLPCIVSVPFYTAFLPLVFWEQGVEITANALHPGMIVTNILRYHGFINAVANAVGKFFLKNEQQGAATQCYVALHPQVNGISAEYFVDSNKAKPNSLATNSELAKKLWDFSLSLTEPK